MTFSILPNLILFEFNICLSNLQSFKSISHFLLSYPLLPKITLNSQLKAFNFFFIWLKRAIREGLGILVIIRTLLYFILLCKESIAFIRRSYLTMRLKAKCQFRSFFHYCH